jgi:hypothetical protein
MAKSLDPIVCRYLTALQMAQFVLIYIHAALPLFFQCDYPIVVTKVRAIFTTFYIFEMVKYGCSFLTNIIADSLYYIF